MCVIVSERNLRYKKWKMAVQRSFGWASTKKKVAMTGMSNGYNNYISFNNNVINKVYLIVTVLENIVTHDKLENWKLSQNSGVKATYNDKLPHSTHGVKCWDQITSNCLYLSFFSDNVIRNYRYGRLFVCRYFMKGVLLSLAKPYDLM